MRRIEDKRGYEENTVYYGVRGQVFDNNLMSGVPIFGLNEIGGSFSIPDKRGESVVYISLLILTRRNAEESTRRMKGTYIYVHVCTYVCTYAVNAK